MKNKKVKKVLVSKVKSDLIKAINRKGVSKDAKESYEFSLKVISVLPDNEVVKLIPNTQSQTWNAGTIVEVAYKYVIGNHELRFSYKNETDLDFKVKNELKAFSNKKNRPNGLTEPKGFIAVLDLGVFYITKAVITKYWHKLNNRNQPSRALIYQMIKNEKVIRNNNMSQALGLD